MSPTTLIIPVHNRRAVTLACLHHLQATGVLDFARVIVVDDGSTDGTAGAVRAAFPATTLLPGDGHLWWTGAVAAGSAAALAQGAQTIIWLNDDCLPGPGAIARLVAEVTGHPNTLAAPSCIDAATGLAVAIPEGHAGLIVLPDLERFDVGTVDVRDAAQRWVVVDEEPGEDPQIGGRR